MFFVGKRGNNLGLRKRSLERRLFLGPNSLKFVVLFVLAAFSLFYLSQSSKRDQELHSFRFGAG